MAKPLEVPRVYCAKKPANPDADTFGSEHIAIDLRDPWLAAFLAWLLPGLGHFYQRRWGKGGLFMTCILATFFYGLWLGGGRVVYASFREPDFHVQFGPPGDTYYGGVRTGVFASSARYAFLCQVWTGLPALPAIIQTLRTGGETPKAPLWDGLMAPPMVRGQFVPQDWVREQQANHPKLTEPNQEWADENFRPYDDRFYVFQPLRRGDRPDDRTDQLGYWNYQLGSYFDMGTVFTMIAGLLNVLAIWDAWGGPAVPAPKKEEPSTDSGEKNSKK